MKYIVKRLLTYILLISVSVPFVGLIDTNNIVQAKAAEIDSEGVVDLVFSTDTHSYLAPFSSTVNGETYAIGGMTRASSYIKSKREEHPNMLLLDAGDYPMGTLYQTLYTTEAFEYRMLSRMGYDAITFGNHDFDYGTEGMALQFEAAKSLCDYYPYFTVCNIDWTVGDEATNRIQSSMSGMNLCEYTIFEKNGLKIGVTGVLGKDAIACAPTCELTFIDPVTAVKDTVAKMKKEENPDCIVVISHSGTTEAGSNEASEDEILAKEVPDIDFIVSGHTHRILPEYIQVGDTYIGSTGCYGENMGYARLVRNEKGRYDLVEYDIVPMDGKIPEDPEILDLLRDYDQKINKEFLAQYSLTADQVIGHNIYEFDSVDDCYFIHEDHNLGQIIADAYRWKIENTSTGNDDKVSGSVAPAGTIRATFPKGDITVSKVYEVFSLGMGLDGTVGYPIVDVYLTGEELLTVSEIDASISPFMTSANLYFSGLEFECNPNRALLNKTTSAWLETEIGGSGTEEIEPEKMYRVVTDLYSLRMLSAVKDISKGLIKLTPKLKDGSPITDESQCVIHDENGNEVKAWTAIAEYIRSFDDDGDGIGEIPALYDGTDDRKIIVDTKNLRDVVKGTNRFFWGFLIIFNVVLVVLIVVVVKIINKIKIKTDQKGSDKEQR